MPVLPAGSPSAAEANDTVRLRAGLPGRRLLPRRGRGRAARSALLGRDHPALRDRRRGRALPRPAPGIALELRDLPGQLTANRTGLRTLERLLHDLGGAGRLGPGQPPADPRPRRQRLVRLAHQPAARGPARGLVRRAGSGSGEADRGGHPAGGVGRGAFCSARPDPAAASLPARHHGHHHRRSRAVLERPSRLRRAA